MIKRKSLAVLGLGAAVLAALPAGAGAHATVSPFQPQGKAVTGARTLYVLRVPNERADSATYRVSLFVPPGIQESIRLKKKAGWDIRIARRDTGRKDTEGAPVYAIEKVTWTARPGEQIDPLFFDDFFFRVQNPAAAQKMCFWVHQFYGRATARERWRRVETVKWTGAEGSETPASCVTFSAAA